MRPWLQVNLALAELVAAWRVSTFLNRIGEPSPADGALERALNRKGGDVVIDAGRLGFTPFDDRFRADTGQSGFRRWGVALEDRPFQHGGERWAPHWLTVDQCTEQCNKASGVVTMKPCGLQRVS